MHDSGHYTAIIHIIISDVNIFILVYTKYEQWEHNYNEFCKQQNRSLAT